MSLYDYRASERLYNADEPFYGLVMTAMRKADDVNLPLLKAAFPEIWEELQARYNAPGGVLPEDNVEVPT